MAMQSPKKTFDNRGVLLPLVSVRMTGSRSVDLPRFMVARSGRSRAFKVFSTGG
jgi:hypothetical protein